MSIEEEWLNVFAFRGDQGYRLDRRPVRPGGNLNAG
jgi:hypothetical protein